MFWLLIPAVFLVALSATIKTPISVVTSTSTPPVATTTPVTPLQTKPQLEAAVTLSVTPTSVIQGEPALVTVNGTTTVKSLVWNGASIPLFSYNGKKSGFIAADFHLKPGTYPVTLALTTGKKITQNFVVKTRPVVSAPLGIPESLGGNTPQAQQQVVSNLAQENEIITNIPTAKTQLWSGKFQFPLLTPLVITDPYGYDRQTGTVTIIHKGTDFRASIGTPVYAMNAGVVRLAQNFTDYGNTIIIDHGLGLQTLYMHLSEFDVKPGQSVTKGELIGKSGQTGYAVGPHLHISVKVDGSSIDPMKFMNLFGYTI